VGSSRMTQGEIDRLVKDYVGTSSGYLNHFTYKIHETFYQRYCDLEIDVLSYRHRGMTTQTAFVEILRTADPEGQARIIRGVFDMVPPPEQSEDKADKKKIAIHAELMRTASRLEHATSSEASSPIKPRSEYGFYSSRNLSQSLTLEDLYAKLQHLYLLFRDRDFFKQRAGITDHLLPDSIKHESELELSFSLFPITKWADVDVTEEHIFDALEFLHDYTSKPGPMIEMTSESGYNYSDYSDYDQSAGQAEFRLKANSFLRLYRNGYELKPGGIILAIGDSGLRQILDADIIPFDEKNIDSKVRSAIAKWRNRSLDFDEKRQAIRELADVFEWMKKNKDLQKILDNKDESALFDIANNFAIRHHNPKQKGNYDQNIWYSWMFHFYLATYHACIRLLVKQKAVRRKSLP
jgi:hypothetical protein